MAERVKRDRPRFVTVDQWQYMWNRRARLLVESRQKIATQPGDLVVLGLVEPVDQYGMELCEVVDQRLGSHSYQNLRLSKRVSRYGSTSAARFFISSPAAAASGLSLSARRQAARWLMRINGLNDVEALT